MIFLKRVADTLLGLVQCCRRFASCLMAALRHRVEVLIIVPAILVVNLCLVRLFTLPGAFLLNLGIMWLLLRLVVRALVFPGSIVFWKRSTEASYRVEMSKQFALHLEQLHIFLVHVARRSRVGGTPPFSTMEGVMLGCMVVEGLARNFRVQQRDQVRFTAEQAHVKLLVHGVEGWLTEAKVCEQRSKTGSCEVPILDWLHRVSSGPLGMPLSFAVASVSLESDCEAEVSSCIERLEQLITIFDGLQHPQQNVCSNAQRFLRVPTVGSLDQLRAELLVRYSGRHYWVRTSGGRKIDAMFISSRRSEQAIPEFDDIESPRTRGRGPGCPRRSREEEPLTSVAATASSTGGEDEEDGRPSSSSGLGSVIVWCNPNAAYYETMAYESHWLDFYLSQGCSVFLFNYSGFGRSQGNPTPSALAEDGNAVVDFLKRRGFTQIGVHGRSIGGIVACAVAKSHQDVVKVLVADRTFSTLADAARFTFGEWAVQGLGLALTWADNYANYAAARCYKVMICDPKDATIPDQASLRTAVAVHALEKAAPGECLLMEDDKIKRLSEVWCFLEVLVSLCDRADAETTDGSCSTCTGSGSTESKRPARQPIVGKPAVEADARTDGGEDDTQHLVARPSRGDNGSGGRGGRCVVDAQWLEDNADMVRSVMAPHIDTVRLALDTIGGVSFNSSGVALEDVLGKAGEDPLDAMKCFLANVQIWGSLGNLRETHCAATVRDLELLLQKGAEIADDSDLSARLSRLSNSVTPESLARYHRTLSRFLFTQVKREFQKHLASIRRTLEPLCDGAPQGSQLISAVLGHLQEVENFVNTLYRFFEMVDIDGVVPKAAPVPGHLLGTGDGDNVNDSGICGETDNLWDRRTVSPRPTVDRTVTGFVMCIECGHNGILNEGELHHLTMHLRAARFGKYANFNGDMATNGSAPLVDTGTNGVGVSV
eukprot:TRINITY_DN20132_c0_g1_i1.p1 TRINITY_DN20132_c0_g1~~TRINITY_DN20132_c0_g1_i1.p1  ORF type:complete len:939 (-),score=177.08 TRINITY_DN20132_c0_g1_i1:70-2886(-)